MTLPPPEGFNYKRVIVSLASVLRARASDWRQTIQLREMAVKGKSCVPCSKATPGPRKR